MMSFNQPFLLPILAAALAVLLVLWALLPTLRVWRRRRRVERVVRRVGANFLRDVLIPDGMDGHLQIDYLVLAPRAVFVLDVREYEGAIFGGANLDDWTQMVGRRSYRFHNALVANRLCRAAVGALAEEVPVSGRVVFAADAWFPKGIPDEVSRLAELEQDLAPVAGEGKPGPRLREAWERIKQAVEPAATPPAARPPWRVRLATALGLGVIGGLLVALRLGS